MVAAIRVSRPQIFKNYLRLESHLTASSRQKISPSQVILLLLLMIWGSHATIRVAADHLDRALGKGCEGLQLTGTGTLRGTCPALQVLRGAHVPICMREAGFPKIVALLAPEGLLQRKPRSFSCKSLKSFLVRLPGLSEFSFFSSLCVSFERRARSVDYSAPYLLPWMTFVWI